MKYDVRKQCILSIENFYYNVAKKYKHTYSIENMERNIELASNGIYKIENGLLRRKPTISCWKDYHMALSGKWYYAYTIDGDTITVVDARHALNMSDKAYKFEESVQMNSAHAMKSLTMFIQEHLKNI